MGDYKLDSGHPPDSHTPSYIPTCHSPAFPIRKIPERLAQPKCCRRVTPIPKRGIHTHTIVTYILSAKDSTWPTPTEMGWKDTIQMNPGEVTTIRIRFTQQNGNAYPFLPNSPGTRLRLALPHHRPRRQRNDATTNNSTLRNTIILSFFWSLIIWYICAPLCGAADLLVSIYFCGCCLTIEIKVDTLFARGHRSIYKGLRKY